MKTEHRLITIHFLEILRNQYKETELLNTASPAYLFLLKREELLSIVQLIYDGQAEEEHPNLKQKTEEELLNVIKDEYYILQYVIEEIWGAYQL